MAEKLNTRTPNAFLMKYILLKKRHDGTFDANQLQEAMERYPADSGVWKIAIEYYLGKDPALAERQIAAFEKTFPAQAGDMLRYKIIASIRNSNGNCGYRSNCSCPCPITDYYWTGSDWNFGAYCRLLGVIRSDIAHHRNYCRGSGCHRCNYCDCEKLGFHR